MCESVGTDALRSISLGAAVYYNIAFHSEVALTSRSVYQQITPSITSHISLANKSTRMCVEMSKMYSQGNVLVKIVLPPPYTAAPAFCLSRSSIFRRAASTISSLLRFSASALSLLLADQPGGFAPVDADDDDGVAGASASETGAGVLILVVRLYRVIRSGFVGLAGTEGRLEGVAGTGITGWNEGGGYGCN